MTATEMTMLAGDIEDETARPSDVDFATKTALRFFLEPKHYRQLTEILAEQWKGCHSLTAAMQLIKAHGREITPQEESSLSQLDEDMMIERLVQLMPQKNPEQFEHFFLQLSFIAATTTRLRTALEAGRPELIEEALDSAENVGVLPYLLKMAVSQAGQEVKMLDTEHDSWLGATDSKMGPLLTTAAAALAVQKELTQAKSTITHFQVESREKSRSVLLGMISSKDQAFLGTVFCAFSDYVKRAKRENDIRKDYEAELTALQTKLVQHKEAKLAGVRRVMTAAYEAAKTGLLAFCFDWIRSEAEAGKQAFKLVGEEKRMQVKIEEFTKKNASNAKSVMSQIAEVSAAGLVYTAFQGFKANMESQKQERGFEKQLNEKKAAIGDFKDKHSQGTKAVLTGVVSNNQTGLLSVALNGWKEFVKEQQAQEEKSRAIGVKSAKIDRLTDKNKIDAMNIGEKVALFQDLQLMLYVFSTWKIEHKVEHLANLGKRQRDKRENQLSGVKTMFKDFASQLECSLDKGTPRPADMQPRRLGPSAA